MVRSMAIESLGQIQAEIDIPEIIATLLNIAQNDINENIQSEAIKSLGKTIKPSQDIVHFLLGIVQNNSRWASRLAAIESLGQIVLYYPEVVSVLLSFARNNKERSYLR